MESSPNFSVQFSTVEKPALTCMLQADAEAVHSAVPKGYKKQAEELKAIIQLLTKKLAAVMGSNVEVH